MDGLVIIDKPPGFTSHDIVARIKKVMGADRVGHAGTLDPLATGVLPVMLNEGTKLAPFLAGDTKEYLATVQLGICTDTLDITGEVLSRHAVAADTGEVVKAVMGLQGIRRQVPPLYSAVKYKGRPLHRWARRGVAVTPAPRTVEVYSVRVENVSLPAVTFRVACSKGTYVRTLCADVGEALGCGATMVALRRTKNGRFTEEAALNPEGLQDNVLHELLRFAMISLPEAIAGVKAFYVDETLAGKLRNGYQLSCGDMGGDHIPFLDRGDMVRFLCRRTGLVAVGEMLRGSGEMLPGEEKIQAAKTLRVFAAQAKRIIV